MGYLEYPAYVEVGRRSRSYSLYIYVCDFKKFWHLEYDYLEYPGYVKVDNGPDNIFYLGYLEVKWIFRSANHTPHVVSSLFLPAAIHPFLMYIWTSHFFYRSYSFFDLYYQYMLQRFKLTNTISYVRPLKCAMLLFHWN